MPTDLKCGERLNAMHPIGQAAFYGLLQFALATPDIVQRFESDSGVKLPSTPKSPIEAMIDKASGCDTAWCVPFIDWCWVNLWGGDDAWKETESG